MKKKKYILILSGLIILIFVGYLISKNFVFMPGIDFPLSKTNGGLQLTAPPEINSFRLQDICQIIMKNISNKPIVFKNDYGIKIYQLENNKWKIIEDKEQYDSTEKYIYPMDNLPFREEVLIVYPEIFSSTSTKIRVVVLGNYLNLDGGKGEKVGAYIDLFLVP